MRIPRKAVILLVAVAALLSGAFFALPNREKTLTEVKIKDASVFAEVARDPVARARGLSERARLPEKNGMLFVFSEPDYYRVWMKAMRFPVDVIWIRDGKVVDFETNLSAPNPNSSSSLLPQYRPDVPADRILETNAGFVAQNGIKIGDPVAIAFLPAEEKEIPFQEYFIERIRESAFSGTNFEREDLIARTEFYQSYLFSYGSNDELLKGAAYIPRGTLPAGGYPILILVRERGEGAAETEAKFFAQHGYATLVPYYQEISAERPYDFYAGDTADVISLIQALRNSTSPAFNTEKIGILGYSKGTGAVMRLMLVAPEIGAFVLVAPISSRAEQEISLLSQKENSRITGILVDSGYAALAWRKLSPYNLVSRVVAPVQIHHGGADRVVPISASEELFGELKQAGKKAEFFAYPKQGHELIEARPLILERALQFFETYVNLAL